MSRSNFADYKQDVQENDALITSVSIVSLSLKALWGLILGGGASMAATPFFLGPVLAAKKDPKNVGSSFLGSTSRSLLLLIANLLFLGSAAGGCLAAARRSLTMAVAFGKG